MNLKDRINAFGALGEKLHNLSGASFSRLAAAAEKKNAWFTLENIHASFKGIIKLLQQESLQQWTSSYTLYPTTTQKIGVVMAGNIPLVGFHDLLSVLISGHTLQAKLSRQDYILPTYVAKALIAIEPRFANRIFFVEHLNRCAAVVATGSNNTARYFKYYFKNVPHIIRKNRSSCAVLSGEETTDELEQLGEDVLLYFGLGCRNVSKIYIPKDYDLTLLLRAWEKYGHIAQHHKYANNYKYQRAVMLINKQSFLDNGILLLTENEGLASPISVVYYERYRDSEDVKEKIKRNENELQCIVTHSTLLPTGVPFGGAQYPEVWHYADNIDTLKFITCLN